MAQKPGAAGNEQPLDAAAAGGDRGEALRASEQRLSREFGRAPYGLIATSLGAGRPTTYLMANDAYCQLTGYSWGELSGNDLLADIHPADQPTIDALIKQVIAGQADQITADPRLVRKDGSIVAVHLTGSGIQPPAGERYLAGFVEDATAAERARTVIGQLEHELARSRRMESLGQLVGGIAHDFSNLLTVVTNYASLVRDEVSVAEATESTTRWGPVRRDVEQIGEAADRAKRLIKHLLAYASRVEARPVQVDLGQLIGDVTLLLGDALGEQIRVVVSQPAGLWPVEADPGLLEQAIINIAVNARDAMPAGGQITIDTENIDTENIDTEDIRAADLAVDRQHAAELAELLPGRYVGLHVTDTGTGMDAVIAERAFEPFFSTKAGDQAAGLGLPAIRRSMAQAGGKAWLRSEPGSGTTVTLILPAVAGSGSGPAAGAAVPAEERATQAGSVLVVDDEPAIREVVYRVLSSAGYRVRTAANGAEALSLLGDPGTAADLVLTDVVMPGMTAAAFADRLLALRPEIKVLFMSGYERPDDVAHGWPGPEVQIIAKPFSRAALLARVTRVLAASRVSAVAPDRQRAGAQRR